MSIQDDYLQARQEMVDTQIADRGIKDVVVIEAMSKVPRHLFVPENKRFKAYRDQALGVGYGQTISQPYIVALTLASLKLKPTSKVLEIGTGSGYLAAVLSEAVDSVNTIEIVEALGLRSRELLDSLGYMNIKVIVGDGFYGYADGAPYDAIIVSAGVEEVPQALLDQLVIGGKLIIPIGPQTATQKLSLISKKEEYISETVLETVRFVPFTRQRK